MKNRIRARTIEFRKTLPAQPDRTRLCAAPPRRHPGDSESPDDGWAMVVVEVNGRRELTLFPSDGLRRVQNHYQVRVIARGEAERRLGDLLRFAREALPRASEAVGLRVPRLITTPDDEEIVPDLYVGPVQAASADIGIDDDDDGIGVDADQMAFEDFI
jgi:hypothetical protein